MHDLSEFMKGVMQRFTQWFNGKHKRSGTLWEQRFKSVIDYAPLMPSGVRFHPPEIGVMISPLQRLLLLVRAGIVTDPAEYRWSGYGEACGGGTEGDGKRAREGIIRAWMAHKGWN